MALSDFTPDTETVVIKRRNKGDFTLELRGLSFHDISRLVKTHFDDLEGLFDIYEQNGGSDLSYIGIGKFAVALVNDAPGLVAHMIALASGEEGELDKAQSLPLIAQIDAIKAIGRLTFSDVDDIKKSITKAVDLIKTMQEEKATGLIQNANG